MSTPQHDNAGEQRRKFSLRLWARRTGLAVVAFLLVSQLVPIRHSNPPVNSSQTVYATESVPPGVKAVFENSCKNCHSNETTWRWYSYVAPASWIVAHDVHQARKKMNFSEWGTYSAKRKEEKLEDICDEITNGGMPDFKYALVHRSARLTQQQREEVCKWTEDSRQY